MHLDRTQAPAFQLLQKVNVVQAKTQKLSNGIPLHIINAGEQEIIRLEINFKAGSWFDSFNGQSYFTIKMLAEGAGPYSAYQINEIIDQYGGFLELNSGFDRVSLVLYLPTYYLDKILPVIRTLIEEANFPENELTILKTNTVQEIQINKQKDAYVAARKFRQLVYTPQHPYGKSIEEADIQQISPELLLDFYKKYIHAANCELIVAGLITDTVEAQIEEIFGKLPVNGSLPEDAPSAFIHSAVSTQKELLYRPDALQSAIRIGKALFTKNHPDYFSMLVTNEILGGYFGSRLMQNIREDKGYTYGIFSQLNFFKNSGFFVIGSDVKSEFTQATLDEIQKEIKLLQQELVSEQELELVKNYIAGTFAGSVGSPLALADLFKEIYFYDLDYSFYENYIAHLRAVTPEQVLLTARKYLDWESMTEVISGKK